MKKYYINMGCVHEGKVYLSGNSSEISDKIEYLEKNGVCKECYKAAKRKEEKERGLIFNVAIYPYVDKHDGGILLHVWFSGDTLTYKDSIKSSGGYWWGYIEEAYGWPVQTSDMGWQKVIKLENLEEEYAKAVSIGAKSIVTGKGFREKMNYMAALSYHKKWKELNEKISEVEKPCIPNILRGHKWNGKVYGKSGSYSIYLDNDKVSVTDDEASIVEEYTEEKKKYWKKVGDIEESYGTGGMISL